MSKVVKTKKEKKSEYFDRMVECINNYSKIIVVGADNVRSSQFARVRKSLRGRATIMMGKNTFIRKIISSVLEEHPEYESFLPYVRGNVGFVFTNDNLTEIRDIILTHKVPAPARTGAIAQCDVFIPAGNTGMGPERTAMFQLLGIPTKINRGQVEILSEIHLVKKDTKVDASQADLMQKMNIKPFSYCLSINQIFEDGSVYPASVLDITDDAVVAKFMQGVRQVASLSLAIDFPTVASIPHSFVNGYKNVLAIAVETDISFKYADKVKDMLANPEAYASAAPAAAAGGAAAAAAPVEEEEEEEEEEMGDGGGLFDDDDDW